MDKKTAFKILDLNDSATFEQAKKAYHNMAKKYHPDVDKTGHGSPQDSEDRMKKINLAFCYLAPVLKSINKIKESTEKLKEQDNTKEVHTSEKNKSWFLHSIFDSLSKTFVNKKKKQPFKKNIKKKKSVKTRDIKQNDFDDILRNAHHGTRPNKKRKPGKHKRRSCNIYQDYMMLKKKVRHGQSKTDKSMDIGKVEKIHPIRAVNPVGRN